MVEEERYSIDILTQPRAIKEALTRAETEVLKDHADHCVAQTINGGREKEQKKKFNELVELFERYKY